MNPQTKEILDIMAEEAAEVIVAISKINRFGIDNYKPNKPLTNRDHFEEEIGDLLAMIKLAVDYGVVTQSGIETAAEAKVKKLEQWSTIFKKEVNV